MAIDNTELNVTGERLCDLAFKKAEIQLQSFKIQPIESKWDSERFSIIVEFQGSDPLIIPIPRSELEGVTGLECEKGSESQFPPMYLQTIQVAIDNYKIKILRQRDKEPW